MIAREYRLDRPTTMFCPDCGGAMSREPHGRTMAFRCHIGHLLASEALLHAKHRVLEEKLGRCA